MRRESSLLKWIPWQLCLCEAPSIPRLFTWECVLATWYTLFLTMNTKRVSMYWPIICKTSLYHDLKSCICLYMYKNKKFWMRQGEYHNTKVNWMYCTCNSTTQQNFENFGLSSVFYIYTFCEMNRASWMLWCELSCPNADERQTGQTHDRTRPSFHAYWFPSFPEWRCTFLHKPRRKALHCYCTRLHMPRRKALHCCCTCLHKPRQKALHCC